MIKLPQQRATDFRYIESEINGIKKYYDIEDYYNKFITNYLDLDSKYHFSECFDRGFVFEQLANKINARDRELFGMPFGVKDVFNTNVLPTTMGSQIWAGFKAGNNARIVDEIVDRGGIVFSKTTTAEFAVHYIQDGKTLNPHNPSHITGTSSAGSAVAVACGALPIALGTQTAGSIVRPASFCGVFGFKPSFGAIDRTGVLKTADTLDTIGFVGSDIYGLHKTFAATFQKESENYFYAKKYFDSHKEFKTKKKLRVGIITDQYNGYAQYDNYVKDDFATLLEEILGPEIELDMVANVEFINDIHALHDTIYCKSLSYYFQEEFAHGVAMSEIMSEMVTLGQKIDAADFINAMRMQPKYRKKFDSIINSYDFLLTPSTASVAPRVGHRERPDTCLIWTFLGYPVLSLPVFWSEEMNLPFGLQLVAPKFNDFSLFDFANSLIKKLA
jgi:Asp-tRNA(Asn)/Glu-tRNA(Gln) amidotransferase A subunit family amidase